jgi:hypothetical protein
LFRWWQWHLFDFVRITALFETSICNRNKLSRVYVYICPSPSIRGFSVPLVNSSPD